MLLKHKKSRRLTRLTRFTQTKKVWQEAKQAENRETARLEGLTHSKAFRPRLCFSQLIIR